MSDAADVDVEKSLRELISRVAAVAQDPLSRGETRTLAAAISLLGVIVGKQEERLRALERCRESRLGDHTWIVDEGRVVCALCGVPRGGAP